MESSESASQHGHNHHRKGVQDGPEPPDRGPNAERSGRRVQRFMERRQPSTDSMSGPPCPRAGGRRRSDRVFVAVDVRRLT